MTHAPRNIILLLTAFFALCAGGAAHGQEASRLAPEEAEKLLVEKPEPLYPAIARAARAHGIVRVEAKVNEAGLVASAKAVSGHPLLQQAAISAVKRRKYKPHVVGGEAVPFVTTVDLLFSLDGKTDAAPPRAAVEEHERDEDVSAGYFREANRCRGLIKDQKWNDAEGVCRSAVKLAEQFGGGRELEKSGGYEMYGHVLLGQKRPREALEYFTRALDAVTGHLTETDAELADLYRHIGVAHHLSRDLDKAREFYRKAEKVYRLAHDYIGRDDPDSEWTKQFRQRYLKSRKQVIEYHIKAAEQAGDDAEVRELKKLQESLP